MAVRRQPTQPALPRRAGGHVRAWVHAGPAGDAADLDQFTRADRCLLTTGQPLPTEAAGSLTASPAQQGAQLIALPAAQPGRELVVPADPAVWAATLGRPLPGDLAQLLMTWLGTLAAPDGDALMTARGQDDAYETILWHCRRQDATLGPQVVLDTVLAQRNLACSRARGGLSSLLPATTALGGERRLASGRVAFF